MPPQRFSRKLETAKPTIWHEQPIVAAPAASISPVLTSGAAFAVINIMEAIAALEIGAVRMMPITTETMMPIGIGFR